MNKKRNPNIILISIDSLRADHVGCYGYHRDTTPNIDKFAKQGTIFKNCYTQSSTTPTSHASLFTGLYPSEHKIMNMFNRLNDKIETIPTILKKYGYNCSAYVNFKHLILTNRMDKDYDYIYHNFDHTKVIDKVIVDLNKTKNPFFIFIHYGGVHYPYHAPEPFKNKFISKNIRIQNFIKPFTNKEDKQIFENIIYSKLPPFIKKNINRLYRQINRINKILSEINNGYVKLNKHSIHYLIGRYDEEINYADYKLGFLFENLKKLNLLKDILIIITSDHGEEFYEHKLIGHSNHLYNTLIKVPFILYGLKINKKIIKKEIMHIDVLSIILNIINKNYILKLNKNRPIISEFYPWISIKKNNYKLIINILDIKKIPIIKLYIYKIFKLFNIRKISFDLNKIVKKENELYDLKNDPYEQKNIINEKLEIRNQLKKELDEWYGNLKRTNIKSKKIRYEKKAKEQLKRLGYI